VVDIPDLITYANFGEDRLRGLGVAGVKVCPSPLWSSPLQHSRTNGRVCARFALCYAVTGPISCLSVLSVCHVGVLWPNGWMDQDATWYEGRPRPRRH